MSLPHSRDIEGARIQLLHTSQITELLGEDTRAPVEIDLVEDFLRYPKMRGSPSRGDKRELHLYRLKHGLAYGLKIEE